MNLSFPDFICLLGRHYQFLPPLQRDASQTFPDERELSETLQDLWKRPLSERITRLSELNREKLNAVLLQEEALTRLAHYINTHPWDSRECTTWMEKEIVVLQIRAQLLDEISSFSDPSQIFPRAVIQTIYTKAVMNFSSHPVAFNESTLDRIREEEIENLLTRDLPPEQSDRLKELQRRKDFVPRMMYETKMKEKEKICSFMRAREIPLQSPNELFADLFRKAPTPDENIRCFIEKVDFCSKRKREFFERLEQASLPQSRPFRAELGDGKFLEIRSVEETPSLEEGVLQRGESQEAIKQEIMALDQEIQDHFCSILEGMNPPESISAKYRRQLEGTLTGAEEKRKKPLRKKDRDALEKEINQHRKSIENISDFDLFSLSITERYILEISCLVHRDQKEKSRSLDRIEESLCEEEKEEGLSL